MAKEEIAEKVKEPETNEPNGEKMLNLRIPNSRDDDEGDVFISVNERTYQIKRGETVTVPECVVAAYKDSERQKDRNYRYIKKMAKND